MSNLKPTDADTLAVIKLLARGRDLNFVTAATPNLSPEQVREIAQSHGYPDVKKLAWSADQLETRISEARTKIPESEHTDERPTRTPPSRPQAVPPSQRPAEQGRPADEIRVLIADAKQSTNKRIAKFADRLLDDIVKLRALVDEQRTRDSAKAEVEKERREARERVAKLEQELRQAKAALRGKAADIQTGTRSTPDRTAQGDAARRRHERLATVLETYGVTADEIRAWAADNGHEVKAVGMLPTAILDAFEAAHEPKAS